MHIEVKNIAEEFRWANYYIQKHNDGTRERPTWARPDPRRQVENEDKIPPKTRGPPVNPVANYSGTNHLRRDRIQKPTPGKLGEVFTPFPSNDKDVLGEISQFPHPYSEIKCVDEGKS